MAEVRVDTSGAEAELNALGHRLYGGCFVLKCDRNHFVAACDCDGVPKRLYFKDHERWCERELTPLP
jgi:hypothetical protein